MACSNLILLNQVNVACFTGQVFLRDLIQVTIDVESGHQSTGSRLRREETSSS